MHTRLEELAGAGVLRVFRQPLLQVYPKCRF
jgi:hypothetical protein